MPRNNIDFSTLKSQIDQMSHRGPKKAAADPRFYDLTFPEGESRATAIIRFLPPKIGEPNFFVGVKSHWFKYSTPEGTKTFFELCPKTIGHKCPVCDYAFTHKEDKGKMPSEAYTTNILVIKDPAKPENEGKVFLFRFKRDVWKKVQQAISPEDDIDQPMNIFDLESAPNLKLVGTKRTVPGFSKPVIRYDESSWTQPIAITIKGEKMSEEFLDSINDKVYSLEEFVSPDKFKSFEELQGKFDLAMNTLSEVPAEDVEPAEHIEVESPKETDSNKFVKGQDTVGANFFDDL